MSTATEVKEFPILFNGEMVRAILDGRKTQTRRIVKFPKRWDADLNRTYADLMYGVTPGLHVPCKRIWDEVWERLRNPWSWPLTDEDLSPIPVHLWVRETCRVESVTSGGECPWYSMAYAAGGGGEIRHGELPGNWFPEMSHNMDGSARWQPSIHMPRWASRISLEITNVRAERLQDISQEDATAEGYPGTEVDGRVVTWSPYGWFAALWQTINGEDSWDANPWVWVVEFRRV